MSSLNQDFRFALRMLLKHPALSTISILIFGLGVGLTATVFSVVNGAFFKGLPFEESDRLVVLWNTNAARNEMDMAVNVHDYVAFKERQTTFEDIGYFALEPMNLSAGQAGPERFNGARISANSFGILRVAPVLGRTFLPAEGRPGADPVILIGYDVWRNEFGGSKEVLGRTVRVNGVGRTIVGVMPRGFGFPGFESLWVPLDVYPLAPDRGQAPAYQLFGRLKRGVTLEQSKAQAISIAADLERRFPETNKGISATTRLYSENFVKPQVRVLLYTMLGAGIGVLLIACVNVANLLLARTSARLREFAVRMALGARRTRILRQLLAEALVLAVPGGILGFFFSLLAMGWFVSLLALNPPPFWITFGLDYRVFLFVAAITLSAGLFAGLIPAWQVGKAGTSDALKDEGRTTNSMRTVRLSGAFVVAEVAISCALLIAAGMMARSIANLKAVKMPFAVEGMLTGRVSLPQRDYPDPESRLRFYGRLLTKLRNVPGVEAAALTDRLPATGSRRVDFQIEGRAYAGDKDLPGARQSAVTPGFFEAFRVPVLMGREFSDLDRRETMPVAVVNESFVRIHFPEGGALGRRIRSAGGGAPSPWLIIVGIVPDLLMEGLGNSNRSPAGFYVPAAQEGGAESVSLVLRTRSAQAGAADRMREAAASLDRDLPVFGVMSMKEVVARQRWLYDVFGTFFLTLGLAALVLALAGLYAVMSFTVSQRTKELSIRAALGAQNGQLLRLVATRAVIQLGTGLVIGLALGLVIVMPMDGFLFGVRPRDPALIGAVLAALAASGLLASLLPARRITRLNAAAALSAE